MTIKPVLKVFFSDFWFGHDPENNFFTNLLRHRFQVLIDPRADLWICSVFGDQWRGFPGKRLFFTGESIPSEPKFFDFSFSFDPSSETNYYLPLYRIYGDYPNLLKPRSVSEQAWKAKKAMAAVFSNQACAFRNWAFHQLSRDIGVGSGGRAFNNVGGPVNSKRDFLNGYRFSFAFENARWPGYTTEKLVEAYASQTVPLYWGDPNVDRVFNPASFLSMEGKADYPRVLRRIREASKDFDSYRSLFEAPLFPENREPDFLRDDSILDFLERVVAAPVPTRHKAVSNFAFYRWHTWWHFRRWGIKRLFWIRFFQAISWLGYLAQGTKKALKELIRK